MSEPQTHDQSPTEGAGAVSPAGTARRLPYCFAEVAVTSLLLAVAYVPLFRTCIEPLVGSGAAARDTQATEAEAQEARQPAAQGSHAASHMEDAGGSDTAASDDASSAEKDEPFSTYAVVTGTRSDLTVTGVASFSDSTECTRLVQAVAGFESEGYALGFCAYDLASGATLAYAPDDQFYTASAIKGPYVASVFQELVDTGQVDLDSVLPYAEPILVSSDNDAYVALSDRLGRGCFSTWLADAGVEAGTYPSIGDYAAPHYPRSTPWQLMQEWRAVYGYVSSGGGASATLRDLFLRREVSPIKDALGERYETWSKAGWYPVDEGIADPVTNDAGVVLADGGPYVVAVMSSAPAQFESVAAIVEAIDQALPAAVGR